MNTHTYYAACMAARAFRRLVLAELEQKPEDEIVKREIILYAFIKGFVRRHLKAA